MADITPYLLFIAGLVLLIIGSRFLVNGASSLARRFGLSSLVIGLTVVSFGTSMPELFINVTAALRGATDISIGNIVGANIVNILLILGVSALIYPIRVRVTTVWKEIPFSLLAATVLFILASRLRFDGVAHPFLSRTDGLLLLCFFAIFVYYLVQLAKSHYNPREERIVRKSVKSRSITKIYLYLSLGLIGLFFGSQLTVSGATAIAQKFGWSDYLISVTVLAIGTTLPEFTTSIIAAIHKDEDMAIGNLVGSNIFNILFVLGVSSTIVPLAIPEALTQDIYWLLGSTVFLFLFMFIGKQHRLRRWQGGALVAVYLCYVFTAIARG